MTKTTAKKIFLLTNLVLVGLTLLTGASIIDFHRSHKGAKPGPAGEAVRPGKPEYDLSRKNRGLKEYAVIFQKDIFNTDKGLVTTVGNKETAEIKESELNLELKGTVIGAGKTSYAVILDINSNIENVYSLGDFIMGARVTEVLKSKVILDLNGEKQALALDQSQSNDLVGTPMALRGRAVPPPLRARLPALPRRAPKGST